MYVRSSTGHPQTVAAIDIGSNSIHLVVARMDKTGHLEILDADKISVRLGEFLLAWQKLQELTALSCGP